MCRFCKDGGSLEEFDGVLGKEGAPRGDLNRRPDRVGAQGRLDSLEEPDRIFGVVLAAGGVEADPPVRGFVLVNRFVGAERCDKGGGPLSSARSPVTRLPALWALRNPLALFR
jgi:hypothetical protein